MTEELTSTQNKILKFIKDFVKTTGIPPSIKEISESCGLSSSSSVHHQLIALEKKGYITRDKTKSRSIRLKNKNQKKHFIEEPNTGNTDETSDVIPIPQKPEKESDNHDYPLVSFDENLVPSCKALYSISSLLIGTKDAFLFRQESHELEKLGIFQNDIVIVEYNDNPSSGEIVMAIANGKIMTRTLLREENYFILIPHDQIHTESRHEELIFIGIIKGLIRGKI